MGAAFLHRTSRLADPGLHVHYLVMNAALGSDGRWTALDGRALYRHRYTADALFQAALRHELVREFGVLFGEADRHGVAEIAGIDKKTRRAFSRRRIEIEGEMTRRRVIGGRAARVATLATRKPKAAAIPEEELRRAWAARAKDIGFSVYQVPRMPRTPRLAVTDEDLAAALTDQHAAFGRVEAVQAVAVAANQGATLDQIDARVEAFLGSQHAISIDEAAMLGTRLFADLVARADRAGAKIIAVGDPKQLPEIEAGGLFSALIARVDAVKLAGNRRQRDPQERVALAALRAGRVDVALGRLERNGNVTLADNADLVRDALVDDWYQAHREGQHAVMSALRRSDVTDLNERARARLMADGQLGQTVLTVDERSFAVGDRVMARRNRYDLGVLNGDVGQITSAGPGRLELRLDDGRDVSLPFSYAVDGHLDFAYARTIHLSQAMTCDVEFLLGDDALLAELGYTGLSRARDRNRLYAVAASDPDRPDDPLADVRHALGVFQAKTAAVDLAAGR